MPVDTSSYPQPQQTNIITTMGNIAGLQGQINQNKLFKQQNEARQAIGRAYQESIDPQTGKLDTNKLLATVSQSPAAAYMAGDVAQQAQAREAQQLEIGKSQQGLNTSYSTAAQGAIASLLGKTDEKGNLSATPEDASNQIQSLYKRGLLPPDMALGWIERIHQASADPAQFRQLLQESNLQTLSPEARSSLVNGQTQIVNSGGKTNILSVSPLTGARQLGTIQNTPDPNALLPYGAMTQADKAHVALQGAEPVGVPNSQGQVTYYTKGALAGTGGIGTTQNGPVPLASGPRPGVTAAAEVDAQESAKQGIALQQTAEKTPDRKALLTTMLANAKDFTPGPNADWRLFAKKLGNQVNPFGDVFDPNKIASQEDFAKQAQQLINAQERELWRGTDTGTRLNATTTANINSDLSSGGIQKIGAQLLGNEDALAAKNTAWQAYKETHGPQSYGTFSTLINKDLDPRIYQMQHMQPEEKAKYWNSLSKGDQAALRQKANTLKDYGILHMDSQ